MNQKEKLNASMQRIDQLMMEYAQCRDVPNDRARARKLQSAVCTEILPPNPFGNVLLFKIGKYLVNHTHICDADEILLDYLMDMMPKYDPAVCDSFTKWIYGINVKYWISDNVYKKYKKEVPMPTLQDPDDGQEFDFIENIKSGEVPPDEQAELRDMVERLVKRLCSTVQYMKHTPNKTNNPVRLEYTQCFVTDVLTNLCKKEYLTGRQINEKEVFESMELGLLDFIIEEDCRSFPEIRSTAMKTYDQAGVSESKERIKLPLENPVYICYLSGFFQKEVTGSLVSQQKAKFKEMLGMNENKTKTPTEMW